MSKMHSSSLVFLFLCLSCISLIEALGFGVELIHRDSPKSPFYLSTETHFQRLSNAFRRSINRVNHFKQRSSSTKNVESDVISDLGEYLMSYSIGTPPFKVLGIVDTGSDIVWLQCKPCNPCYEQTTPIFDPSKSTTYTTIPCTSIACQLVRDSFCSSNGDDRQGSSCQYLIQYGDSSKSEGDVSVDTLTLGSTKGSPVTFPDTMIGCGHSNTGTFRGEGSGIVGLANGPLSLISQLNSSIQGKFSYCLVPALSSGNFSSKLNFGDDAVVSGEGTVSTPMILDEIFYYLTLKGFSVGSKRIEFGSSSSSSEGNIIIDSGTTLTLLPDDVYSELESAVAAEIKSKRVDSPNQFLNLCYKSTEREKLVVPLITAHFSGADVGLNDLNTFVQVSEDVACFAFRPDSRLSIFGNLAQQNLLVGYDLQNKAILFKPTDCTKQ
ncbi:hypothetical protein RIF29_13672 [Crotalaria pallida]|uniref:Peptidase A1 domain-containing protein n=1 Tax=Crotalaria pallida TaxID=3830 RepID=A0AAN9P2A4_CROPI